MKILRLSTAGSVDDGKSTLIGRLLYDTNSLSKDKIENIRAISAQRGLAEMDLSLITDGLTAEREQGITIDVAHIYFNTPNRKYIVADTPGHVEYTRNMITGASNSDVFVILIDARNGIIEQTKRHLFIAALMEIKEIVFVINKMDLVNYEEHVYRQILTDIEILVHKFDLVERNLTFIPVSAKTGDNVAQRSTKTQWYTGPSLLEFLENIKLTEASNASFRFNVQYVIRPHSDQFHDFRGYAGKVKSGTLQVGDEVKVTATNQTSKIKAIWKYKEQYLKAKQGDSVTLELEDDIDLSRGDVLILKSEEITGSKLINAQLCWLNKEELVHGGRYLLQHGSTRIPIKIDSIESQLDFETLEFEKAFETAGVNSINQVNMRAASPIFLDTFKNNPSNGYFILIDEGSNHTVGVGFNR